MSDIKEMMWWQENHPSEYAVFTNALGIAWIQDELKACMGIARKDHHRLVWCIYHPTEGNFEEVMMVVKLLETFGADPKINYLIQQLRNTDGYHDAICHLLVAYQFKKFGWKISLEIPNGNRVVDFMATKSGELAYVECSRKLVHAPLPFDTDRTIGAIMSILGSHFGFCDFLMEIKNDGATKEEVKKLLENFPKGQVQKETIVESSNLRFIINKSEKENSSSLKQKDLRIGLSLAERMLKKIDDENKQTSSKIAIRVVALQLAGRPRGNEWETAEKEIFERLKNKQSKPDVVFFFKKVWDGQNICLDLWSSLHLTYKGELLSATTDFLSKNEIII
jgi:hypothetical protein